jgi:peptidoglycan hydrolase-like protein with peptidoglycan-binding domain
LLAVSVVAPIAVADNADAKRAYGSRALKEPMRGSDVRKLQKLLTTYGLPTAIDGQFGGHTASRVRAWETATDRVVNGRVSRRQAIALQTTVASGQRYVRPAAPEPTAAAGRATLAADGITAIAPPDAPAKVRAIIAAGNEIATKPYKYGGGHGRWNDIGYDCSGSISYVLHAAGLLDEALDSTGFMSWGKPGKGSWVTTYAHGGHSYMVVAGLRFDTSGLAADGSRWHTSKRSASGYTVRHPNGL